MAWTIEYTGKALKALKKIDKQAAGRILDYIEERVAVLDDPRTLGKPLKGTLGTLWRYRVGDYRILCDVQDEKVVILVAHIGHRKEVYR